ncbi:MAG: PadR family transcriptional regulator [Vicinamibacterales bacterium]
MRDSWGGRHGGRAAGGGPWGWGRFFGAGEVRLALLSLVEQEPKHGYQLMKELEERSGGFYRASAGTIYPTLQLLEDEGLVLSEASDGKKVYRITEAGRAELVREAAAVKRIWRRADSWEEWTGWMRPETASLAGPLSRIAKAAISAVSHAEGPAAVEKVLEVLDRSRRELEALRTRETAGPGTAPGTGSATAGSKPIVDEGLGPQE